MMLQIRELAIMLGGGVCLGLAVVVVGAPIQAPATAGSGRAGPQGQYTPELIAAREQYLASKAHDEARGVFPANQGSATTPAATDRTQQIANAILSNPNATMRDVAMAAQILNVQAASGSTNGQGYAMPSYSTAPIQFRSRSSRSLVSSYNGYAAKTGNDYGPAHRPIHEGHDSSPPSASSASMASFENRNSSGAVNPATGEFYAPAGAGYVSTRDGTYYAPAGPNGVIDSRTGAFVPTAP